VRRRPFLALASCMAGFAHLGRNCGRRQGLHAGAGSPVYRLAEIVSDDPPEVALNRTTGVT
jgi:hypothetical protein